MSSWRSGLLSIKCSIDVLQKALVGIVPEWRDRIVVGNDLKVNNQDCDLIIKSDKDSGVSTRRRLYHPVGFRQEEDGRWICISMDAGINFDNELKQEIASITIKKNAAKSKAILVEEDDERGYKRMVFHVPVDGPMKWGN